MKVSELMTLLEAKSLVAHADLSREVSGGCACDMLSWVMKSAQAGMAWATVQAHMNVIAVAVLMELSCVIITEDVPLEEAALQKADAEHVAVLSTALTSYEVCGRMYQSGIV